MPRPDGRPEGEAGSAAPRARRWRWWRVAGVAALVIVGLLVVFHRILLLEGFRLGINWYAERQGLTLTYTLQGNPLGHIVVTDLEASSPPPGFIEHVTIRRADAYYSLWTLLVSGASAFLEKLTLVDARFVFREPEPEDALEAPEEAHEAGVFLPIPRVLVAKNVTVVVQRPGPDFEIRHTDLSLFPDKAGAFAAQQLMIPGVGTWKDVESSTSLADEVITFHDISLPPYVQPGRLAIDLSSVETGGLGIEAEGVIATGTGRLTLRLQQGRQTFLEATLRGRRIALEPFQERLPASLQLSGQLDRVEGSFQGYPQGDWQNWEITADLQGSDLRVDWEDHVQTVERIDLQAKQQDETIELGKLVADFGAAGRVQATGRAELREPYGYAGKVEARLDELGALQGLLAMLGREEKVAGSLDLDWTGKGTGGFNDEARHEGDGVLRIEDGRFGSYAGIEAKIQAHYTPDGLQPSEAHVRIGDWRLETSATWEDERLRLSELTLHRQKQLLLSGTADLPLALAVLTGGKPRIDPNAPVHLAIEGQGVPAAPLLRDLLGYELQRGQVDLSVKAEGTLEDLRGRLHLQARDLVAQETEALGPAALNLDATLADEQLKATGRLEHRLIESARLTAQLPFDAARVINGEQDLRATPLDAEIRVASVPLQNLKRAYPEILSLRGTVGGHLRIQGTVEAPDLQGKLNVAVPELRFDDRNYPALTEMAAELDFQGNRGRIATFSGRVAGGLVKITGSAEFPTLTDPVLDVDIEGDDVLLYRDAQVMVRADLSLAIDGPWSTAQAKGTVGVTKSQFYREVDILPLELPGHQAPAAPKEVIPRLEVTAPPFRDWTFDIIIRNIDPFLIKGNLANGVITPDLHLTGTGLAPQLNGTVSITNLEATLPFSTLQLEQGALHFSGQEGLNATLDLRGTSEVRDYRITVQVYGTLRNPEVFFLSQPPLPQEDIVTLLATGATRDELTSDSSVVAGKASWLAIRKIWQTFFPTKKIPEDDLLSRVELGAGSIDSQSSLPSLNARIRMAPGWYTVFDAGLAGRLRGRVKYLIRFR